CDWYAVGAMLYEALAGRPPFKGSMSRVLYEKQHDDPPPLAPGSPDDLAVLCLKLLARDPLGRPRPLEIAKVVAPHAGGAAATGMGERRLVGRDGQLADLEEAWRDLQQRGQPMSVFVAGRSGEGKTSLIESFLRPLRGNSRAVVMSGRCYDRESVPFKAL